jgi:hypothetical protein
VIDSDAVTADSSRRTERRHLVYLLALLEAGLALLAALGQGLFLASPLALLAGAAIAALFITAGAAARRGRRWGLVALIIADGVRLAGFALSAAIGLFPWVELPLTGATLVDGLLLPIAIIALAALALPAPAAVQVQVAARGPLVPPSRMQWGSAPAGPTQWAPAPPVPVPAGEGRLARTLTLPTEVLR